MNMSEIRSEISKLEEGETNWTNIQKLSWLYTVADHARTEGDDVEVLGDSEFMQAIEGKSMADVLPVIDELMQTVSVMLPAVYKAVMRKL